MFATLAFALLAQVTVLPPSAPQLPLGPATPEPHTPPTPAVIEDFEAYTVAPGTFEDILSLSLDEFTVTGTGQGPGLVAGGCGYAATGGSLRWNGDGYLGLSTETFCANSGDGLLIIRYMSPQNSVDLNLHAYTGFPDTAEVAAYDYGGGFISSTGPVSVPDPTPVPVTVTGPSIGFIEIRGVNFWSPIIDLHEYGLANTLQLTITGPCPGTKNVTVNGGIPGNICRILYSAAPGSWTITTGPCAGTTLGLAAPVFIYNGPFVFNSVGSVNFSAPVPAAVCGYYVQAIEGPTCNTSNVVVL